MNWLKTLKDSYEWCKTCAFEGDDLTPLEYLCGHIFDITTYAADQDEKIGKKVIEVIDAINNRTTFDYIKNEDDHTWYLLICNLPFFKKRLNWGTSIRGAWWDYEHWNDKMFKLSSCGLVGDDGEQQTDWELSKDEWEDFMRACVEFATHNVTGEFWNKGD